MAIQIDDIEPRRSYDVGSTPQAAFTIPFPFFDTADIRCSVAGMELEGGFTVTGAGQSSGGTLTLSAPVSNTVVMVWRDVAIKRTSQFPSSGPLRTEVLNTDLNKQIAVLQQIADRMGRSIGLPDAERTADTKLPTAAIRARKSLIFDDDGNVAVSTFDHEQQAQFPVQAANAAEAAAQSRTAAEEARDDAAAIRDQTGAVALGDFVQASPGAVPRPVVSKLRDTVSVRDFGAVGDGEAEDAAAFQAAADHLASLGGGVLRVPAASRFYRLGAPLEMGAAPISIEGDGAETTGLGWTHAGHCIHFLSTGGHVIQSGPGAGRTKSLSLRKITVSGHAASCGAAVRAEFPAALSSASLFQARDVVVTGNIAATGGASHGLWLTNAGASRLDNVTVHGRGTGTADPPDAGASNQYAMRFGILLDSSGDAPKIMHYWCRVRVQDAHWGVWFDGHHEGIYGTGLEIGPVGNGLCLTRGASADKILGVQFANLHVDCKAEGISLNGVDGAVFTGGLWLKNSGGFQLAGNVFGASNCAQVQISNAWLNCATPAGTNENGVYLTGNCPNPQFSNVTIIGAKTAGFAAAGMAGYGQIRGHVQDCGAAAVLGPATGGMIVDITTANSGPVSDGGSGNKVLARLREAAGTATSDRPMRVVTAGSDPAYVQIENGMRAWALSVGADGVARLVDLTAGVGRTEWAADGTLTHIGSFVVAGAAYLGGALGGDGLRVIPVAASNRRVEVRGSNGGSSLITTSGGDLELAGGSGTVAIRQGYTFRHTGSVGNIVCGSTGAHIEFTRNAGNYLVADGPAAEIVMQVAGASQVVFKPTAAANRQITLTGSNGGNPSIGTSAGGLTISARLRLSNLPTSSAGLSTGDLWSDGGTIKVA